MNTSIQNGIIQTRKFLGLGLIAVGVLAGALLAQAGDIVPYHSKTAGQITYTQSGITIEETGIGTHIGKFTLTGATGESGLIWFTVTAANGDNLFGVVVGASETTLELAIFDGTGRFKGATGNITATTTIVVVAEDPYTLAYTATTTGTISTVGSAKKK